MLSVQLGTTALTLVRGDITVQDVGAIVNAANEGLVGGGGVDGAIHRAAGPRLQEECMAIRARQGGCRTGEAVITSGGLLKARHVIHTVGPVWQGGENDEERLLASAYTNSLQLALGHSIDTVAFPCISTGVYGFPSERAAAIAMTAVREFVQTHRGIREVRFVVFLERDELIYSTLFAAEEQRPTRR